MNDITLPRAIVEQALEALEQSETTVPYEGFGMARRVAERKHQATITNLRAALAQQAEPVQEPVAWSGYDLDGMVEAFSRVIEAHYQRANPFQNPIDMDAQMALRILRGFIPAMKAYTAPPQQAEPAEPRRWEGDHNIESPFNACMHKSYCITLKQAPPQRKPLTEEEIERICMTYQSPRQAARAVERAHGIKE